MDWPPRDVEIEDAEWTPRDLREGDLVFGQKDDGPLAWLCAQADEPWRHVGSVIADDGRLRVVEILGDAFRLNDLEGFFRVDRYQAWGAARLRVTPECADRANAWMRSHLGPGGSDRADHVYAWDDLILAGLIAAAHRGLLARHPARVRSAIEAAGRRCKKRLEYEGRRSLTCSAFVQLAYEHAGGSCVLEHRRWRGEPVAWPVRSPTIDEAFEMTEAELAGLGDASVVDLVFESERIERSTGSTRIQPGHVGELARVLCAAIGGYAVGTSPPDRLGMDSRWVTPGDLWRSPSVRRRALIRVG